MSPALRVQYVRDRELVARYDEAIAKNHQYMRNIIRHHGAETYARRTLANEPNITPGRRAYLLAEAAREDALQTHAIILYETEAKNAPTRCFRSPEDGSTIVREFFFSTLDSI